MKSPITLALAVPLLALNAAAASTGVFDCSPFPVQIAGGNGTTTVTCPGYSGIPPLTSVSLLLYADYTGGTTSANDVRITYTIGAPAGVTWASSIVAIDVIGGASPSGTTATIPVVDTATAGVTNANFLSAYIVGVSAAIISGGVGSTSVNPLATTNTGVKVSYTAAPEPLSSALVGFGLAAAFALKRLY